MPQFLNKKTRIGRVEVSKEPKPFKHPEDCQCGKHKAHNVVFEAPKTAEQINTLEEFTAYLSFQLGRYYSMGLFEKYPNNFNKLMPQIAKEICELCREQFRQQLIEEIDPFMHLMIPRLRTKSDINQYAEWWQEFREGK